MCRTAERLPDAKTSNSLRNQNVSCVLPHLLNTSICHYNLKVIDRTAKTKLTNLGFA